MELCPNQPIKTVYIQRRCNFKECLPPASSARSKTTYHTLPGCSHLITSNTTTKGLALQASWIWNQELKIIILVSCYIIQGESKLPAMWLKTSWDTDNYWSACRAVDVYYLLYLEKKLMTYTRSMRNCAFGCLLYRGVSKKGRTRTIGRVQIPAYPKTKPQATQREVISMEARSQG